VATYGFSEGDAKRIGRTVRLVERYPDKPAVGGPEPSNAVPGVRLLLAKHSGEPWATLEEAVVTVYNGNLCEYPTCTDLPFSGYFTMMAVNHYTKYYPAVGDEVRERWITLGHNGFGWTPVDSQDVGTGGNCINELGGVDFRAFAGYRNDLIQILGHDIDSCVRWYDVFTCATAATCE
jgi:hypothetical protein